MLRYIANRLLTIIPTLFVVSIVVFGLQRMLPGDAAIALAGDNLDPAIIAQIRTAHHLDQPIVVQYALWLGAVLHGDLGQSLRNNVAVSQLIGQKLPATAILSVMAMAWAVLIGVPAGIVSALHKGRGLDYLANIFGLAGLSVPPFWLGLMLILFVSVKLGLLPASGYISPLIDPGAALESLLLPSFVLGINIAAVMMRHTRSAMLTSMAADYIRTARAKGLYEHRVILRHGLRNALLPLITMGTLQAGQLLAGAVLTEQVFTIPGFGRLIIDAVYSRDYAVVQGVVLVNAIIYVALNLIADLAYGAADPDPALSDIVLANAGRAGVLRRLLRSRGGLIGLVICVVFIVLAAGAPVIAPYDPLTTDWGALRQAPSEIYWFGTDDIGRDVLSRVIWGSRASLMAGVVAVLIAMAVGVPLGTVSGYVGGVIDVVLMRITDGLLAVPALILAIALAAFLGPSLTNAMIAIGIAAAPVFMRLTRGQMLATLQAEYVEAARSMGYSNLRIIVRHILPNIMPVLLVQATLSIATAIIAEAGLSFLGLGQQPPAPSWGASLNAARSFIADAPWMSIWPGAFICLAVFGCNLLGDGLRDVLDPRDT